MTEPSRTELQAFNRAVQEGAPSPDLSWLSTVPEYGRGLAHAYVCRQRHDHDDYTPKHSTKEPK